MRNHPLRALQGLATGLCRQADIRIEAAEDAWYWDPGRRVIGVHVEAFEALGLEAVAGIVAHECGHVMITRGGLPPQPALPARFLARVHNALEDPRVEVYVGQLFPGALPWMDESEARLRTPSTTHRTWVQQFLTGVTHRAAAIAGRLPPGPVCEPVADLLLQTLPARRAILATTPIGTSSAWRRIVDGRVEIVQTESHENAVNAAVDSVRDRIVTEVLPAVQQLMQHDLDWLLSHYQEDQETWIRDALEAGRDCTGTAKAPEEARRAALDILTGERGKTPRLTARALRRRPTLARRRGGPGRRLRPPPATGYGDPALARRLAHALAPVFAPAATERARTRLRRSGSRPHLPAVFRREASPTAPDALWLPPPTPRTPTAAVQLLVDLSGSMRGAKIRAAVNAAAVILEALRALRIPSGVAGFQDQYLPMLPLGLHTSSTVHPLLARMEAETAGAARGGHNRPGSNDDGPAVHAAAGALAQAPVDCRVLLVLSDGQPSAGRGAKDRLHEAVAHWTRPGSPLGLVGLGLGQGTEHVASYYADHCANIAIDTLPTTLARAVATRLLAAA